MNRVECAERISQLNGIIMMLFKTMPLDPRVNTALIYVSDEMNELYEDLMCTCEGDDEDD